MTQIFAHRGSAGTHPENTMIAFQEALRVGADGIELDVQLTKDNELVIIHDEKLERTTNGKGFVKDHTLREIKKLNASHKYTKRFGETKVPALAEFFDWFKGTNLLCNIELKNGVFLYPGMEAKVIEMIRKYRLEERIIFSSFNHYSIVTCYQYAPEIEIAPLYRDGLFMPWVYAQSIRAKGMHPNLNAAPDIIITSALEAGVAVRPYTVNSEEQMRRLASIGCSAFFTDYPQMAREILGNR